jgi:hypothetical protein
MPRLRIGIYALAKNEGRHAAEWATTWARCSNVVKPWLCDHNETILEAGP